mmetsp:Transcript_105602/g.308807  ORF Transcript_105602/g.308807 Transcript_105602/m.308807 type:complete len:516 (-) Transcript_105602:74-1621(-)
MAELARAPASRPASPRAAPELEGSGTFAPLKHEDGPIFSGFKQDIAPYVAECVGTFLLTLTFLLNYSDAANANYHALANAFMNMVLKCCFGHVSGANLNPSLTISMFLAGRLKFRTAAKIILAQVLGACCAGSVRFSIGNANVLIGPNPGHTWRQVAFVEIMYTSLLCFVFLNTAASTRNNPRDDQNGFYGVAIGLVFIAGSCAGMSICHAMLNSAVAIGFTIVDFRERGVLRLAGPGYLFHDLAGAFLGTWFYRLVRPGEFDPVALQMGELDETPGREAANRVTAEFLGAFYIVLTKALNRADVTHFEPWSMTAVIAAMAYSVRDVSGAYFNPAVTASVVLSRRGILSVRTAVWDVLTQLFAGAIATALCESVHPSTLTIRFAESSAAKIAFGEMFFTGFVCYGVLTTSTVMPVACKTKRNNIAGLVYGGSHMVGCVAASQLSGSLLNPVVALSFAALAGREGCLDYIFFELAGAVGATAVFFLTHVHLYTGDKAAEAGDRRLPGAGERGTFEA